ncbi:MAG: transketolase [Bacteroidetes bacterium]|nr:transketolase [Bacteroidota bacterium]
MTNRKEKVHADFRKDVLNDYSIAYQSRQLSLTGRREVLTGKAKFGIFGDGKEVAQVAYARYFQNGDWRSGYYRDQTFLLAAGLTTLHEFFAQLYGITSLEHNPSNGGRSFNNHFASRSMDKEGNWKDLTKQKNSAADLSPTAAQVPRLAGLALASKLYRNSPYLKGNNPFSIKGNEVAFGTIGDASTSEGHFFEVMNAAGVLQIPLAIAVWDDGYGISVSRKQQTIKESISEALKGFAKENNTNGILIYKARGWNYPELCNAFQEGIEKCRKEHIPVLFHIDEVTQPQGHSTSGSHERYKSKERLEWEKEYDPMVKMREWIIEQKLATSKELEAIEEKAIEDVKQAQKKAWKDFQGPLKKEMQSLLSIVENRKCNCNDQHSHKINDLAAALKNKDIVYRKDIVSTARKIQRYSCNQCTDIDEFKDQLKHWLNQAFVKRYEIYNSLTHCESAHSALLVKQVKPIYEQQKDEVAGREIIRDNFDKLLAQNHKLVIFGEDCGKIGGVNQGLQGLQEKYGDMRVMDTGIRELTIVGKGIGMALRGLRPIAEIQYLDYLLYALQALSDDLSSVHWRTVGGQVAPLIIRTRGHRFEGPWHASSPMSMAINSLRGMFVCTPRNMTQAAGMYNTLIRAHDPAIVIEPLNGYRLKESIPDNLGEFTVPLGVPEILKEGNDITIVTYGSCVKIALEAIPQLEDMGISVELIDVQTLLPFDIPEIIVSSIQKTKKALFFDEDMPGGASSYMMQKVVEEQQAYKYLHVPPRTLAAKPHRPAYGTDGDYFSKPGTEDLFDIVYEMMNGFNPNKYPTF